jgi:uncharacterized membrane protein
MYLYVKAIHIFSVVVLIGGMLAMALALRLAAAGNDETASLRFGEAILRWDAVVTTPALASVWMAGFTMAFGAGWDSAPWLLLKMVPAIFLSGLHLVEGIALRLLLRERQQVHRLFASAPVAILLAVALTAWLAVTKPF